MADTIGPTIHIVSLVSLLCLPKARRKGAPEISDAPESGEMPRPSAGKDRHLVQGELS